MASSTVQSDSDDGMDEFMDKFKTQRYKNAFSVDNWEEEFNKVPMFMKTAPEEIDPQKYPELACLQAIIHDEDRPPEEQAKSLKDEGNAFFKEKNYQKAILSYTAGLKKKCGDQDLSAVLLTNRAAAHFHLGNMRSAMNDAAAARKIKPDHLKALIRGAQCCIELRNFSEAIRWCDEGLKAHPSDKKLQELRAAANKHKRAAERDARRATAKEKKLHGEKEALLAAIEDRGIKLLQSAKPSRCGSDSEDEDEGSPAAISQLSLDGLSSQEATGAQVFLDEQGSLHWPVLFLYPEHQQSDFISAFCESSCFVDHLAVMFGEGLPPWDTDRKYHPQNLQLYFEDEEKESLYQVNPETSLLRVLQHKRFFVKAGTPSFIVLVNGSPFRKQFLTGKKIHGL
ncbi:tetratricopeptide repeat protein 4 [Xiphias gladius]|uniref:tetratricopeptide repeat protein 4 n=1 Tax=Xiphias gladius TaxID=8245 RepID=UPI001A983ABC|nr:tetratricopeptide repeat protein 4 [Xiphias gladius]XP_039983786.1 tetratricopeptide repeat protein 4 [Xiphias gladius]XP_039983787.1 tetratricopeptide repeat protein 4 [Xiphias gladius]XP_039983788.1 tetratricopeptide repeat protein 4 [Xiphias gladius]